MGIYTDLLNNAKSWDSGEQTGANSDTVAGDRAITREIKAFKTRQGDPDIGNDFAATDEIQSIATYAITAESGNFTLTVLLRSGEWFTTASIAYNANAATIETAIDVAATAAGITDWTNADISVALGTDLNAGDLTLTYDGDSVTDVNHQPVVITDVDLFSDPSGAVVTSIEGVAPVDEVQQIPVFTGAVDGGNYTLALTLNTTAVTTANIIWNANAATIESAIDTVATGNVTGWTNGDVTVTGGDMNTATVNFTYDGDSVSGTDNVQIGITNVDLTNGDVDTPTTLTPGFAAVDEEQSIAVYVDTVSSGNYTLEFTMNDATNVTTANLAYDANAATIETAIDTVMTGNYGGWVNGDIVIAGGPLTTNAVTLTYSGTSVDELNHAAVVIDSVDLDGHTTIGAASTTTHGQSARTVWEIMEGMGLITGGPPVQGTTSGLSATTSRNSNPHYPKQATLKALAQQAAIDDDNNDLYGVLMALFGQTHTL